MSYKPLANLRSARGLEPAAARARRQFVSAVANAAYFNCSRCENRQPPLAPEPRPAASHTLRKTDAGAAQVMDAMPPPPTDPAAEALQLASTEIPEALDELGRKHDYVNDVVQWCESSYQSGDKNMVLKQTKEYLVDALEVVAKEVETTSAKLIRFLSLQNDAVEGLGLELDAVRERLALAKAQNAAKRMEALCPERKREPSQPRLEVLDDAARAEHMCTVGNYESSLQKRMNAFDAVGSKL